MIGKSPSPDLRCQHCGRPVLSTVSDDARLARYRKLLDRMNELVGDIEALAHDRTVEARERWWKLQDEFTEVMRKIDVLLDRPA